MAITIARCDVIRDQLADFVFQAAHYTYAEFLRRAHDLIDRAAAAVTAAHGALPPRAANHLAKATAAAARFRAPCLRPPRPNRISHQALFARLVSASAT